MLGKPGLEDAKIIACLQDEYRLRVSEIAFLPVGADQNTAVYRAMSSAGTPYFVKLRRGAFNELAVRVPKFLSDRGIRQVMAPLITQSGQLWANLETFRLVLYPFIHGQNGFEVQLTDQQWQDFGSALLHIHTLELPVDINLALPRETYSANWRKKVGQVLKNLPGCAILDATSQKLVEFLMSRCREILDLVQRTGQLAGEFQTQAREFVLCHADIHAGNILIDANAHLYIVDWDDPILAPKERDLMFIGGGQGFRVLTPQEEEGLFYRGYGPAEIDPVALAYYRYERIIQDIALFSEQILSATGSVEDREQSFRYLVSNFRPDGTLEIARKADHRKTNSASR